MTHVYIYTHCYHSACTSHPHHSNTPVRMYQTIHEHTHTPLNEHTHHQLQKLKRPSTSQCHCIHTAHSFFFTTHTIIFLFFFCKDNDVTGLVLRLWRLAYNQPTVRSATQSGYFQSRVSMYRHQGQSVMASDKTASEASRCN